MFCSPPCIDNKKKTTRKIKNKPQTYGIPVELFCCVILLIAFSLCIIAFKCIQTGHW